MDRNKISWLDHPKIILPDEFVPELLEYEDMVVHFVRHAEALHKVNISHYEDDKSLRDPDLSPLGRSQCEEFAAKITRPHLIDYIECSPLTRAIETTSKAFAPVFKNGQKHIDAVANPLLQNFDSGLNGKPKYREDLEGIYGEYGCSRKQRKRRARISLGLVKSRGAGDTVSYNETEIGKRLHKILARLQRIRNWHALPRRFEVVVVTHGTIISELLGETFKRKQPNLDMISVLFDGVELKKLSVREVNEWREESNPEYLDSIF